MVRFGISLLPIIFLILCLSVLKLPGYKACVYTWILTCVLALFGFQMPVLNVLTATLEGTLNALWPICIVIIAALFVYDEVVKTGAMEKIKEMLLAVSKDKVIILLLIGWGFSCFMEGMAGFGTAVAIPAGILIAMGFEAMPTVIACLVANSTPTPFGSVAVPITTVANITGIEVMQISTTIAILQFLITCLSPFIMVWLVLGKKEVKKKFGFILFASLSLTGFETLCAMLIGPELANIIGAIGSMLCMVAYGVMHNKEKENVHFDIKDCLIAWSPFIFIFVFLLFTSSIIPPIHNFLAIFNSKLSVYAGDKPNTLTFFWIDTPGIKILLAGIVGGLIQGLSIRQMVQIFANTLKNNLKTILTICSVLSIAKIMGYSGMIAAIALVLVQTAGNVFPLFSPFIGMVGGFVTGSGTSSAVLFGNLQATSAEAIGVKPLLLVAANGVGSGIGKMISPQNIAIGCAAGGLAGKESIVLKKTVKYAIGYIILAGILCYGWAMLIK